MKKVYLLTILIFAAAVNLSAARLPLPDIDIDEPAKPTASMSEEKNVLVQQQSSSFSAQDTLKPQESFNIPEIDVFKEENLGQSEFQSLEAPVSVDAAGAFGNLENLTKTLQANFQNAFSNIKSLTSKYNSLAARYQELVKKYNGDMKNVIQKAQIIQKQLKTATEYFNKSREENSKLKEENLKLKNMVQQQTESINKLNSMVNQRTQQLQNLNAQYEKAVLKLQQIKSTLVSE